MSKSRNKDSFSRHDRYRASYWKNSSAFKPIDESEDDIPDAYGRGFKEWQDERGPKRRYSQLSKRELDEIAERADIAGFEHMSRVELQRALDFVR